MKRDKKVIGAFLGTIVEYYDYSLYGFSAAILSEKFFPGAEKISGLMYVFAIYSLSYFAKPIGALFFSHVGDLYGRVVSLRITIIGIAFPTLIIGILPEYESIGVFSVYILILCRFLQGFFTSGEYDGAAIYVIEHLGKKRIYTASSFTRSSGVIGLLLGIASTNFFNSSIFPDWCWRVPFVLSAPLALVAFYFRGFLQETSDFDRSKKRKMKFLNIISFIKERWKVLICVILLAGGFGSTYQVSIIFMKQYLPMVLVDTRAIITSFSVAIVMAFGVSMPISGILSDRFGCIRVIKYSVFSTLIASILLIISIKYQLINLALLSSLLLAIFVAPFNALAHGVIIKAFNTNERYRGIGVGHTIGSMLMSGTTNYTCLFFMKNFNWNLFPIFYIILFSLITYIMVLTFYKTSKNTI